MRAAETYRAARRNAAREQGRKWSSLPLAALRLKHSRSEIKVRAVPTLKEPPNAE